VAPGHAEAQSLFDSALGHAQAGRLDEAIDSYRRALELRPDFFEALANMGNLLQRTRRRGEAIEAYRRALALRPQEVNVLTALGTCELNEGRPQAAIGPLEEAVRLRPDYATALNALGVARGKTGDVAGAVGLLRRAAELRPDFVLAWSNLGEHLQMAGDDRAAIAAFDRALALDPANEETRFRRASLAGSAPERAPDAFVKQVFDRYAADFDVRLTRDLEYRTPEALAAFIAPWLGSRESIAVLDLGCGTGLAGPHVRARAARLVGVDLSAKMLERAAERGIYDELAEAEVVAYLEGCQSHSYDLVLAVDVLVYIGALEALLRAAARVLRPDGLLAFSTEDLADETAGYHLERTGRYVHGRGYVKVAAAAAGLKMTSEADVVIRKEAGRPVAGRLYSFTGAGA
jgi:predicted TPR repeat methyltransferase